MKTAPGVSVLLAIILTSVAAAVTIPPTPTNPIPGSTTSPGPTMSSSTVTMSWNASSGATYYGFAVRDMSTNTLVVDTTTTSTSYTANLTAGRTYRWNVAAANSAGTSAYTTPRYFTTPSAVTIPATPANPSPGSTSSPGPTMSSTTVTMSWSASSGATYYGFAVRDMTTNTLVVDTTTTSTSYTANLTAGRTYRWNVAAANSAGTSAYTTPRYFTTPSAVTIPATPANPSPGSTSSPGPTTSSTTVTMSWSASSGATSYGIGVRDMTTNTLIVDTTTTSTSYTASNLTAGRTYRWNVAAMNSAGSSAYTTPLYFTTPSAIPATPANPSPGSTNSPGPTTSSTTVTMSWSASSGATSYGIGVRDMTTNTLVVDTTTTSTSYTANNLTAGRTYRWNVAAMNSSGTSAYTTPLYFTTPGTIPPTPSNPSPGSTSSPGPTMSSTTVTMSWSASSGATSYGIGVRDMTTNTLVVDTTTTSTNYTASNLAAGRTYRWNVAAINSAGSSAYTTPLYFTTPGIPSKPANPTPGSTTSPGPTTSSTTVTMSWSASAGATSYGIGVRDMVTNALVVDTTTTSTNYTASNLAAGRTYRWNVAAINSGGTSAYTTPLYFTTPGTTPATPTNPTPGSTTSPGPTMSSTTVTMSWSASSGATSYGIGVRDMVTNALVVDTTTTSTSYTASNLSAGRTYRWNVAAVNSAGSSAYTAALYFTVPAGTTVPLTPGNPTPGSTTSPGPTTSSTTVTISWSASSGATSYGIGVRDMTTNALVVDTTTTSTGYTASNLAAGRTYRWNVAAMNSSGTSAYTTARYFTTPGGSAIPAAPADTTPGSTTRPGPVMQGNNVTLHWSASAGATSYGIAVRNVVTNDLIVDAMTGSTSYTASNLTAGTTYRWNVAAFNSAGTSSYTTPLYFQTPSTTGLTVTVITPNGGEIWNKRVPQTISWSVNGDTAAIANFYISYSIDGGATYFNDVGGTVPGISRSTSWTPPLVISPGAAGRIRVQARNATNVVLAEDVSDADFSFSSQSATGMRFDRAIFFARHATEFPNDPPAPHDAFGTLLGSIENDPGLPLDTYHKHLRWAAYMLATVRREAGYGYAYNAEEGGRGVGKDYGYRVQETGYVYYGRGYVQLTWDHRYKALSQAIGRELDLYYNPNLALDPQISYEILSTGMREGKFTSLGLERWIKDTKNPTGYYYARQIVNGLDNAQPIADAAESFERILEASLINAPVVATPAISPESGTYIGATSQQLASASGRAGGSVATTTSGEAVTVSLACVTDGATIYYTTDGSTPTTASTVYLDPFTISDPTKVNAIAVAAGYGDSGISAASFAFTPAPNTGAVSVTISPDSAISAGAEWQIDGGEWHNSGDTVTGLSPDTHTLAFKPLTGWTAPATQPVIVNVGQTIFGSSTYTADETRIINLSGNLGFGNVPVGSNAVRTMTISNSGNAPLNVISINYPTGFVGDWPGGSIASDGSQNVTVTFAPTVATAYGGTVTVNSDETSGTNTFLVSGTGTVSSFAERINFSDNQLPTGWTIDVDPGHAGNTGIENQRFEARQVDTYAALQKDEQIPATATALEIDYTCNVANNYWGMGEQVQVVTNDGKTYVAAFGKAGYGAEQMHLAIGDSQSPQFTNDFAPDYGTYRMSATFRDGQISFTGTKQGASSALFNQTVPVPGFLLHNIKQIRFFAFTTTGDPAWIDDIDISLLPRTQMGNISTRLSVGTGDNVLIGGFIITGSQSKKVIVRAIGPSLSAFGLSGLLADPMLELHDSTGALIVSNNNWKESQQAEIQGTGLAPSNDFESAVVRTLDPGAYTAILRGAANTTGVALVETYDLARGSDSRLANISTRGFVQTGDNVMIGGLIVQGTDPTRVIVRAIGPSLSQFGIANSLQDPTLELHDGNGALLMLDDNWRDNQQTEIQATGLAPSNNAESAILSTLSPGVYTAIVRGKNDTSGVALVEAYQLDN